MGRFVEGQDRGQITLFPDCLEDWIGEEDNPVRVMCPCSHVYSIAERPVWCTRDRLLRLVLRGLVEPWRGIGCGRAIGRL
jgi:hypothetical protein